MDDLNDIENQDLPHVSMAKRNLSQTEDESLISANMDIRDDDIFGDAPADDEDDLGSSSEVELSTSPLEQSTGTKQCNDSGKESNLIGETKLDMSVKSSELNQNQSKRSSVRLRKEKVPNQRKNLIFPGTRPRITNRGRKFNLNPSDPPSSIPFKSPSNVTVSEPLESEIKSLEMLSNLEDGNSSEDFSSSLATPETSSDAIIPLPIPLTLQEGSIVNQINEKLPPVKKKLNYPGKIKGKLNNKKKAKTVENRRKRAPKGKFKPFSSSIPVANFPSTSGSNIILESDSKQDDANENKIILCSSKDYFVLTQDVCVMCGSLGKGDEARLLSCSQCGQCYHPFCAGITKITKIMLKKGWRCLECTVCEGCGKPTDESRLLLCDDCDISYHTYCLEPPLENVPQGTWKCQWCVICVKCSSTSPGSGSQWQANYTLCGPCASQENCSICKECYQENDLIIQCIQCSRWLHSRCDSLLDEDECEIASCIGYNCLNCRPADEPPSHIQAQKNGTLRSILNKKRPEEKIEPTLAVKIESVTKETQENISIEPLIAPINLNENVPAINTSNNKLSKYHLLDGVYLTDHGLAMIKSLALEPPKKTRVKRKVGKEEQDESQNKEIDDNLDEKTNDPESLAKQNEEERKKRQRQLRLEKLGIGGFLVKQRGRLSTNKEDDEVNADLERSGTPDGDKPKRRRRIAKKKSQLQEAFPSYMQEAFFGKNLMDAIHANGTNPDPELSEPEFEEEFSTKSIGKDKIVNLSSMELTQNKNKNDDINNFLDDNFHESLDDLPTEGFEDLNLSPDEMLMDMLINDNLERNDDEVLDELTNSSKIEDGKDELDLLGTNFNFNDIEDMDETGLPQMDSKDVEDLFNEVMSDSSIQQANDFPMSASSSTAQMLTKPNVTPLQLPNLIQAKVEMEMSCITPTHTPLPHVSTPITPLSSDSLASLTSKPFEPNAQSMSFDSAINSKQDALASWSNGESESETSTQGQKNFYKWETEEALGPLATISPVLYANLNCPNLKNEYPIWADRLKQISKLWRQLTTDQRQPFLQKARENRAASRIQKSQSDSSTKMTIGKEIKAEPDQKHLQSPHSNCMMNDPNSGTAHGQQISSQNNEMGYHVADYGPSPSGQMYSPSQMPMHAQVKMQSCPQMIMNRPPATPGLSPQQSPMSPIMHSPRLRPGLQQGAFPENYSPQQAQAHQMNIVRPASLLSQNSFSPSSPNLNAVHSMPSNECYQSSNPSTPQRPQSTDPQHPYNQAASPYVAPPRTPSSMMNPFSPNHHTQMPIHSSSISNENYPMTPHPPQQANKEIAQNIDIYKVNMTPQHQISKPHTPDSFVSLPSSLPSTPQPPSSPQVATPSPLNDIYARSPATPRSAPVNQQVRPAFEDNFNQRSLQSDIFSPSNPTSNYQQPYVQSNTYNMTDSYVNSPGTPKVQMRPNMNSNIRPNMPIRRAVSDPYARQPMTPMPSPSPDSHQYIKTEEAQSDQVSKQQQLRSLLQVQQMRRQDSSTSQPRPNWSDNGFRQPLSPAMIRNRVPMQSPNQYSVDQTFRYQTDQQRMMIQRNNEIRFRQMGPVANQQFPVRYPHQQIGQLQSANTQQQQQSKPQQQQSTQQHWPRMSVHSPSSNPDLIPAMNQVPLNQISGSPLNSPYTQSNQNYQPIRNELSEMNVHMQEKNENKCLDINEPKSHANEIPQISEDENLPVELGDDDDLLELGNDFNILEYADPELADKSLSHSGKSNIFDVFDEKDMLNEKEKEGDINKTEEKSKSDCKEVKQLDRAGFNQTEFNSPRTNENVNTNQMFIPNKPNTSESEHTLPRTEQSYFPNLPSSDSFLSDDDFERFKMDYLSEPSESNSSITAPLINSLPSQHQSQTSQMPPVQPQHMNLQSSQPPMPPAQQPQQQGYHLQHNAQYSQANANQPMWQEQPFVKQANFANRMHIRMAMNQPSMPRHIQANPQPIYGSAPNRIMMQHHQQPQSGHLPMSNPAMNSNRLPIPAPPFPPTPSEQMNEQDRQQQIQYEQWLIQQNNFITNNQKHLETDMNKLRKIKKSLNAKQRQCRKNGGELNEHDSSELARVTQEIHTMQKTLDATRKQLRHHNLLIQEYRNKCGTNFNLPHSPGAPPVQTSPRSVNSPLAALNTSGPGTPLGIGPSTPQSPSLTSPSPSSLVQNSPLSTLHSPASMMPHSPIHHSPMPNPNQDMTISMRPQIVQEDNNPFSDVYLQKEKKQHMQQSPAYAHQMNSEMMESRQMYGNNYNDDGSMQQYYHSQQQYQMNTMRPQSQMHFSNLNESSNFRFNTAHGQGMSTQYVNQQLNYQQIRRPPPPPYPGNAQHYSVRPFQNTQIRAVQMRSSQECMPMRMQHHGYNEPGVMMPSDQYGMNQPMDHMPLAPMDSASTGNALVGEAKTTMEFNISELGPGHDNQSDPTSLAQESNEKNPPTSADNENSGHATNSETTFSNAVSNFNSQESINSLPFVIKNEIDDPAVSNTSDSLNEDSNCVTSLSNENLLDSSQSNVAAGSNCDNSSDEFKHETKQNALLKQLLQNCPSADLNKSKNEAQNSSCGEVNNSQMSSDNDIKTENFNRSLCQIEGTGNNTFLTSHETSSHEIFKTDSGESNTNDLLSALPEVSSPGSTPIVEKKLTYLDIRRAQLERDPTPPPEEAKPKRKRAVKRKESKSLDETSENGASNQSCSAVHAPKTKKRARKGSQNKTEDPANSNEHHEQLMKTLLNHLRSFPAIQMIEPQIKPNMNVCLPVDGPDFNLPETKLRGSYGNAFLSSAIDYYSTYPFGPNKASTVVPTLPPAVLNNNNNASNNSNNTNNSHNRAFYFEEFSYMKNISELKDHFKEQGSKSQYTLYSRDADSPETIVSSSSPESVIYDMPRDEYNKMKYINDDLEDFDFETDRQSPTLFTSIPVRPIAVYPNFNDAENDKENSHETQNFKSSKINSLLPLKENGNVNITLTVASEKDVRELLLSLAKMLNLTSPLTYNIEKSPSSRVTEILNISEKSNNGEYCKYCDKLLEEMANEVAETDCFCNNECSQNYFNKSKLTIGNLNVIENVNTNKDDVSNELVSAILNETEEHEIVSILGKESEETLKTDNELDNMVPCINVDEKKWKNTRYFYWSGSSFKNEQKTVRENEDNSDSVEHSLDKLAICLKPKQNSVDIRVCIFCHENGDGHVNGPSRLLNMDIDKWVHLNCALWSNEVYEMLNGALMNVDQAYKRAMNLNCVRCDKPGASLKCFKIRCNNSYHFPCAIKEKCMFFKDKTIFCPQHSPKGSHPNPDELTSFVVGRRVFINRDEPKQIAAMIHQGEHNIMRIGSLLFLNIGQLLPHQLQNFHTNSFIYPVGYKISRFYWSFRKLGKRSQYICSISEVDGKPEFSIEVREEGYDNVTYHDKTPKQVWQKILEPIIKMREESQTIKVFVDFISGEDLFGLTEPAIIRILESLPGVDTLYDYNFKYGRSPWYELPLAINPTGCARTEPKMRTHFKRPHTLHVSTNNQSRSSLQSSLSTSESSSPYVKQFVHSKISQYRKMKQEWRCNVYLGRSRISGLGLYAVKDIEKHTMIIEYIGHLIRNEIAERNERVHEAHNRGIYMFRLDDNQVIDATLSGGLARYVNHSCDPNCVAECVQIDRENKILIIANRRIQQGEELTYDYKFEVEDDQHKIPCNCSAANCRKWMN